MTVKEFEELTNGENKTIADYKNSYGFIQFGTFVLRTLGVEKNSSDKENLEIGCIQ